MIKMSDERIFWDEEFNGSCKDGLLLRSGDTIKTLIQTIRSVEKQGTEIVGLKLSMDKNTVYLIQIMDEEVNEAN